MNFLKLFAFLITLLQFSISLNAQVCSDSDINLTTQAQIDNFPLLYPDCDEINGVLLISGADISNLDSLIQLKSITGGLGVFNNSQLTSLDGLDQLELLEGGLGLQDNAQLSDISSLSNLDSIKGALDVNNNAILSLDGLSELVYIEGFIKLLNNNNLTDLNGLSNNLYVGGDVTITNNNSLIDISGPAIGSSFNGGLEIRNNQSLTSIDGLEFITQINGLLHIEENPLTSLNGLDSLVSCEGMIIKSMGSLTDISAIFEVDTIFGSLELDGLGIDELDGFNELKYIEQNLLINSNMDLTSLHGFGSLDSIGANLEINNANQLTSLNTFENLISIGGGFKINGSSMSTITEFPSLNTIGGTLSIHTVYTLENLECFTNLTSVGAIDLSALPLITNLNGFENLIELKGNIDMIFMDYLENIDALSQLTSIGGDINFSAVDSLSNLNGFSNLENVGGGFRIYGINKVNSLSPLSNLTSIGRVLELNGLPLDNFQGLNNLIEVGGLDFNQLNCIDFSGLEALSQINETLYEEGNFYIGFMPELLNFDGLQGVQSIDGNIWIKNNPLLSNIDSLSNVSADGINYLKITYNPNLDDCSINSVCEYISISDNLTISDNGDNCSSVEQVEDKCQYLPCFANGITFSTQASIDTFFVNYSDCDEIGGDVIINGVDINNLDGLINIAKINGDLIIGGVVNSNPQLESLSGLSSLINVFGSIEITENSSLLDLNSFYNLKKIDDEVRIVNNASLESIIGLSGLDSTYLDSLIITGNPILSLCANQSICEYISSNTSQYLIENNATGCNSIAELSNACTSYIYESGINFLSQQDVDEFIVQNPGVHTINGNVTVFGADINNLNGLSNVSTIVGGLTVLESNLTELTGLENLQIIQGELSIIGLDFLINLDKLSSLQSVGDRLRIMENDMLQSISALESVSYTNLNRSIKIEDNAELRSLNGLQGLTIIQSYQYTVELVIKNNPRLQNLSGLDNLITLKGDLEIINNDSIQNLEGLNNLVSVEGLISISENELLSSTIGMDQLTYCEGMTYYLNPSLINFNGFTNLESLNGVLNIEECASLVDIEGFESLSELEFSLIIDNNDSLISMSAFQNLTYLDGSLVVRLNYLLPNLDDLLNVIHFSGSFEIKNNPNLISIEGLGNMLPGLVNNIKIYSNTLLESCNSLFLCNALANNSGTVTIHSNSTGCNSESEIENICSLDSCFTDGLIINTQDLASNYSTYYASCSEIYGDLIISGSDIINVDGLESIQKIHGDLIIENNPLLESIFSLLSLDSIEGSIIINNNLLLSNIEGLSNIIATSIDSLTITNNDSLSHCAIGSFCSIIANESTVLLVSNNTGNCNSVADIIAVCEDQPCIDTFLLLTTQEEVDNFPNNYPFCTKIDGSLQVDVSNINNIDSLIQLKYIGGDLQIYSMDGSDVFSDLSGLSNLDSVGGMFRLSGLDLLSTFNGLANLKSIGEYMMILNNATLTSLDGFDSLHKIGLNIDIHDNPILENLNAFTRLDSMGSLTIVRNDLLSDLSGLDSLKFAQSIYIDGCDNLINLMGLGKLKSTGDFGIFIKDCLNFSSFEGLNELQSLTELILENLPLLSDFSGLESVEFLNESIKINNLPTLIGFTGFNGQINGGDLEIVDCEQLLSLSALGNMIHWRSILIDNCDTLSNLQGLENIHSLSTYLTIQNNDNLLSLAGLNNINGVGQNLTISQNTRLNDVDGLVNLHWIYGDLTISDNDSLHNVLGLDSLDASSLMNMTITDNPLLDVCEALSICEFITVSSNDAIINNNGPSCSDLDVIAEICESLSPNLIFNSQQEIDDFLSDCIDCENIMGNVIIEGQDITNLDGLGGIVSISGNLTIGDTIGNPMLTSLNGLSSLTSIGGNLSVQNNASLTDFSGVAASMNAMELSSLTSIGGNLKIAHNETLISLLGLEDLETIGGNLFIEDNISMTSLMGITSLDYQSIQNLYIFDNPELSTCQVQTVCSYIGDPTGLTEIYSNNEDCNSADEVYAICSVGVNEFSTQMDITLHPNPAKDQLFISSPRLDDINEIRIFNQLGKEVFYTTRVDSPMDISSLLPGLYIVQIMVENGVFSDKLVVE